MFPQLLHLPKFGVVHNKFITSVTKHTVAAAVHANRMMDFLFFMFLTLPLTNTKDLILFKVFLCMPIDISSTMNHQTGKANPWTFIRPANVATPGGRSTVREPGGIKGTAYV